MYHYQTFKEETPNHDQCDVSLKLVDVQGTVDRAIGPSPPRPWRDARPHGRRGVSKAKDRGVDG